MMDGVSVIICCYNSEARLPETLGHLKKQITDNLNWEIVVVDNASSDNTFELANQILSNTDLKWQVVKEDKPGLIYARLKGEEVSKYDYLLYCDDDNWLAENYVQLVFDTLSQNSRIAILGGQGEAVFEDKEPAWFKTFQDGFAVGDQSKSQDDLSKVDKVYGAGFTLRKSFLTEMRNSGLKSLLTGRTGTNVTSGEDIELCFFAMMLGLEVWYDRRLKFKHFMAANRMTWDYMKKLYAGFGKANIYMHAYNHIKAHNTVPDANLRLPFWLDSFIHKVREIFRFYPKVRKKFDTEGNSDVLRFIAMKAEAREIWKLKENYSDLFQHIYFYFNGPRFKE